MAVQWLRLHIPVQGVGLIPGQGAKIPCALWPKNQNGKQKPYCNKSNKDYENGPYQKESKKSVFIILNTQQWRYHDKEGGLGQGSSTAFWMWIRNPCDFPTCRKQVCIICGIWGVEFKQIYISKNPFIY